MLFNFLIAVTIVSVAGAVGSALFGPAVGLILAAIVGGKVGAWVAEQGRF